MKWKTVHQDEYSAFIVDENDIAIFTMSVEIDLDDDKYTGFEIDPDLAIQIVREHNSHAALLAACKLAKRYLDEPVKTSVKASSLRVILQSAIKAGEGMSHE